MYHYSKYNCVHVLGNLKILFDVTCWHRVFIVDFTSEICGNIPPLENKSVGPTQNVLNQCMIHIIQNYTVSTRAWQMET